MIVQVVAVPICIILLICRLKQPMATFMREEYYRYQGLDVTTGIPTRQTLEELDLKDVADELEERGILT